METITITKKEYQRLKNLEQVDCELVGKFKRSLEDMKAGRVKRVR